MKRVRRDNLGSERLFGMFIFLAVFILVGASFMLALNKTIDVATGDWDLRTGYELIGNTEYTFLSPEEGYPVNDTIVQSVWDKGNEDNLIFDGSALGLPDEIEVAVINDNDNMDYFVGLPSINPASDKFYDYVHVYTSWGWWSSDNSALSYEAIIAGQVDETNRSVVPFYLRDDNYSLVVTTPGPGSYFPLMVRENLFNLSLAVPSNEDDLASMAETSMWTMLGQMLTAQLPDVHPAINFMIAVPFWTAIGFMIVMIASRFIPLVGGG